MSVFGPNQVEELIVGSAVATETNVTDFVSDASVGEIKAVNQTGGAVVEGDKFKFLQKTDGDSAKGLDFEFSDVIDPSKVKRVTVKEYSPEVNKKVTVSGIVGNIEANTTYIVEVRLFNDGGSLSTENFAIVSGYFVTGSNVSSVTADDIRDGLLKSLQGNLKRRGNNELVITAGALSTIEIEGKPQRVVAGKDEGRQIEFEVIGKAFAQGGFENLGLLEVTVDQKNFPGVGTGKYAVNLEWFTKGTKYEVYRQTGYPADFGERTPYYTSQNKTYNVVHVHYFMDRESPTVENQNKILTLLVERTNLASNGVTNSVLADLRAALGSSKVPANLAVA